MWDRVARVKFCPHCGVATENATSDVTQVRRERQRGQWERTAGLPTVEQVTAPVVTTAAGAPGAPVDSGPPQVAIPRPQAADGFVPPPPAQTPRVTGGRRRLLIAAAVGARAASDRGQRRGREHHARAAEATINTVVSKRTVACGVGDANARTPLAARRVTSGPLLRRQPQERSGHQHLPKPGEHGDDRDHLSRPPERDRPDSNASTAAKQHFFTLYKQLRSQVGQPPSTLGGAVGGLACAADALANALTHSEANG